MQAEHGIIRSMTLAAQILLEFVSLRGTAGVEKPWVQFVQYIEVNAAAGKELLEAEEFEPADPPSPDNLGTFCGVPVRYDSGRAGEAWFRVVVREKTTR